MRKSPRMIALGFVAPAMVLVGVVGCDNQDPGQPAIGSISAPAHKASLVPPTAAARAKKAPARH